MVLWPNQWDLGADVEGSERKVKGRGGEVVRVHHFGCSETMSGAAEVRQL